MTEAPGSRVATVGYGDQFPVTRGGRIVGVVMLTVGVALFATFSGFLANAFLSRKQATPAEPRADGVCRRHLPSSSASQRSISATARLRTRIAELESHA